VITSPLDCVEIKVIVESQNQQFVVGKGTIPVAELALFLEDQGIEKSGKNLNFALEMEYLPVGNNAVREAPRAKHLHIKCYGNGLLKDDDPFNHKNLLSKAHEDKLILLMEAGYVTDAIRGARELKSLKHIHNKFILPEAVSYNDYINSGYDAMMRKQKKLKQQKKGGSKH